GGDASVLVGADERDVHAGFTVQDVVLHHVSRAGECVPRPQRAGAAGAEPADGLAAEPVGGVGGQQRGGEWARRGGHTIRPRGCFVVCAQHRFRGVGVPGEVGVGERAERGGGCRGGRGHADSCCATGRVPVIQDSATRRPVRSKYWVTISITVTGVPWSSSTWWTRSMRECAVSRSPARGGGPKNRWSCSIGMPGQFAVAGSPAAAIRAG